MNLKTTAGITGCFCAVLLLAACQRSAPPAEDVTTLYVGPAMADGVGVGPMTCLLVKDAPDADYRMFYDSIQGFDYVPGFEYELRVKITKREPVPADASSLIYSLVEVVAKQPSGRSLEDDGWTLKDGDGIHAEFLDGTVSGHAGVNRYSGSCTVDGTALVVGPIGATLMAGPQEAMDREQRFLGNLAHVTSYKIVGEELRLLNADGRVILVFVPRVQLGLTSNVWKATGVNNGKGGVTSLLAGTEITASFGADGTLSGSSGCNNFSGGYEVEGNVLKIGPLAGTRKMCARPEGIMEQEGNYLQALEKGSTYRIDENVLELRSESGSLQISFILKEE